MGIQSVHGQLIKLCWECILRMYLELKANLDS